MSDALIPANDLTMMEALAAVGNNDFERAESHMFALPQVECPVVHKFAPGLYIREIHLPAGSIVIGNVQKTSHLNLFLQGKVQMLKEGLATELLTAPMQFVSPPGRKVGYIVEDVVWQNVYATEETDISKLEEMFFETSETARAYHDWRLAAMRDFHDEDRADYAEKMTALGLTEEVIQLEVQNPDTLCDFPSEIFGSITTLCAQVADSPIHGKGFFATSLIRAGEFIAVAALAGKRTPAGRYTNHAKNPSAVLQAYDERTTILVALHDIGGRRGGNLGDEITIDYLETLKTTGRIPKDFTCHQQSPQQ